MVLTAKHHDGFCLFDTKTTDYCATKRGVEERSDGPVRIAVRTVSLKVGLYFTTIDWHDPDFATIPISKHIQTPQPNVYDPLRWWDYSKLFVEQLHEILTNYGRIAQLWRRSLAQQRGQTGYAQFAASFGD